MGFPALPGHRFAYDKDGTVVRLYDSESTWVEETLTAAEIANMNSDYGPGNEVNYSTSNKTFTFLFPEARTIRGMYKRGKGQSTYYMDTQYSTDTTNGLDGTWSTIGSNVEITTDVLFARANLQTFTAVPNVKGLRLESRMFNTGVYDRYVWHFHIYGDYTGASDRLSFWDPTLDQEVGHNHFDFGDVGLSTSSTISFRVKNSSATLTANSITLGTSIITDWPTPFLDDHDVNYDGGAYASSVSIGTLAPGAISNVATLRRTTPSGALTSPYAVRVDAAPASWS